MDKLINEISKIILECFFCLVLRVVGPLSYYDLSK
jgi:hypothetical protein